MQVFSAGIRPWTTRSVQSQSVRSVHKVMAANRGEIAVRIMRAGTELGMKTVGIFSFEDRHTEHRYKSDESFLTGKGLSPVGAYLDVPGIVKIAAENGVTAVHPGYGLLSERADFAKAVEDEGIAFVGPTVEQLNSFGDKTAARAMAIAAEVPVVPGTDGPVSTYEEAAEYCKEIGFPVIVKATMGGGGRGMRVVLTEDELEENFTRASSEALAAFGDGTMFIERYVKNPKHIEVQVMGDGRGNVLHFYDRDCTVQRRHQKVIECAPSVGLPEELREAMFADAVRLTSQQNYRCAGTVEFLVGEDGRHYFIEVNPRIQVEHTVSEEITGVDLVQTQIRVALGETFEDMNLSQDTISAHGHAMQCRVTTEVPEHDFRPDTGVIQVFRAPTGMGIRLDGGPGFVGANITPHYDSLLVKLTAHARERAQASAKLLRALAEFRIRGVHTNIPFLAQVLKHPDFVSGNIHTGFIAEHPELLQPNRIHKNRGQKLLGYLGHIIVNGCPAELGASGGAPSNLEPKQPDFDRLKKPPCEHPKPLREIYKTDGAEAFAKAVRANKALLLTDTTWRDAHQSLLATRMRTRDIKAIAPATRIAMANAYSLECWGGATFDVAMRFLKECPWDRLAELRELVPDIPFQMLLRGANAVGYTSYPDNVVHRFCEQAVDTGMDVFRVFDSLNYVENMRLGIDAVGGAGGIVEAALCYTGDVTNTSADNKYPLDYYLNLGTQLKDLGAHAFAVKDMAGLLKPAAAKLLIGSLRQEFPDMPIHVHTHDTAGTGVASMLECAYAGADAVDVATDAMCGTTSQPSMGAVVASLQGTELDTGLNLDSLTAVNEYWEGCREVYAPFESGQKSGSPDVYEHEIPGGQYTNMLFQSRQLGLQDEWPAVKKAYAAANRLLGDIVKVTPSSKVVGDLAQFIVTNKLTEQEVIDKAGELSLPESVLDYLRGGLGIPHHGFPEPLRSNALSTRGGLETCFKGRPGAELEDYDFEGAKAELEELYGAGHVRDVDVTSHALYPQVFKEFKAFEEEFGDVSFMCTPSFVTGLRVGEEASFEIQHGKTLFVRLVGVGDVDKDGNRAVIFDMNGHTRIISVADSHAAEGGAVVRRVKADPARPGHVGCPMPGVVLEIRCTEGDHVNPGDPLVVLSAMKMETMVTSKVEGRVSHITCSVGDNMEAQDLLVEVEHE